MKIILRRIFALCALLTAISASASPTSGTSPAGTKPLLPINQPKIPHDATELDNQAEKAYSAHDYATAARDYAAAAKLGDCFAEFMLGGAYMGAVGGGVPRDYQKSVRWLTKASSCKDQYGESLYAEDAEYFLGSYYDDGGLLPRNYKIAKYWYEKCAVADDADCETSLGFLYLEGHGVSVDYETAAHWLEKSASQADGRAEMLYATLYAEGDGVLQNYVAAYKWILLAKVHTDPKERYYNAIQKLMDFLAHHMTPEQIALAQQQAAEWRPPKLTPMENVSPLTNTPGTLTQRMPDQTPAPAPTSRGIRVSALSPADLRILRLVLAANGTLTKGMHDKFWSTFQGQPQSEVVPVMSALIDSLQMFQEYQLEIWKCVQTSYETQHVYRSQRLLTLQRELPARLAQATKWNPSDQEYKEFMAGFLPGYKQSLNDMDRVLNAAAAHQSIAMPDGSTVQVNEALIRQVLAGIKGSIGRLQELLNPNWNGS